MANIENSDFLIYDLETFDIRPKYTCVSQFAARRYSSDFEPIDDGTILYCKLPEDHMPSLEACILTGITPQFANEHGDNELEFARKAKSVLMTKPGKTIISGYNNTTFDNWVMNFLFFRNLMQPYEPFRNRSLDCFTITKAVHHMSRDSLKYVQVAKDDGTMRDSLKLEHLSRANSLTHTKAHDALSDVEATAGLFSLIKKSCDGIFAKYLSYSRKDNPARFLESSAKSKMPVMIVTRSPRDNSDFTTLAMILGSDANSFYAFDLLCNDKAFEENLAKLGEAQKSSECDYVGSMFKFCHTIKANEGPYADYPENYFKENGDEGERKLLQSRLEKLNSVRTAEYTPINSFRGKKAAASGKNDETSDSGKPLLVEETLLDGFLNNEAGELMDIAENGNVSDIERALRNLKNKNYSMRVKTLFTHMVARNFPELYSQKTLAKWHEQVKTRLMEQKDAFVADYNRLIKSDISPEKKQILKEVADYEEGIFDKFSLRLF